MASEGARVHDIAQAGPLLTIAIPSFNRPQQLRTLLQSIDCDISGVEILISEDNSPLRAQIREVVISFAKSSEYKVTYRENDANQGFDGNIRSLVLSSRGQWIMFMGDDDEFIPGTLNGYIQFLRRLVDEKYVLRSYRVRHQDGRSEDFRYLDRSQRIEAGEDSVAWLFKRSVTLSGFTIDRREATANLTDEIDGTLLLQVYLMARVCIMHSTAYCHHPTAQMTQTYRTDRQMFGTSNAERTRFSPGSVTSDNSINFTKAYFEVTQLLDKQLGTSLTPRVRRELSKYSYPFLSIQRKRGFASFLTYAKRVERETGLGETPYFHIYKWSLALLGEGNCDRLIGWIKRSVGHAPNL